MTEIHELLQQAAPEPIRGVDVAELHRRAARQRTRDRALGGVCALLVVGAVLTVGVTRSGDGPDEGLDTARTGELGPPDRSDGTATGRSATADLTPVDDTGQVPGRVPVPSGFVDAGSSLGTRTYVADATLARAAAEESRRPRDPSTSSGGSDDGAGGGTAMERAEEAAVTVPEATIYLEDEEGSPSSITVTVTEGGVYAPELLDVMVDFSPTVRSVTVRGRPGVVLGGGEHDTTSVAWQERDGLSFYVAVIGADEQWLLDYTDRIQV